MCLLGILSNEHTNLKEVKIKFNKDVKTCAETTPLCISSCHLSESALLPISGFTSRNATPATLTPDQTGTKSYCNRNKVPTCLRDI